MPFFRPTFAEVAGAQQCVTVRSLQLAREYRIARFTPSPRGARAGERV